MADPRLERLERLKRLAALQHKANQVTVKEGKLAASAPTEFENEAQDLLNVSGSELAMGSAPVRFAMGAAAPFLAFGQHMGNLVDTAGAAFGWDPAVGKKFNELLQSAKSMKERGMEAYGQEGVDLAGIAGEVMSPVSLKAMKMIKPAKTAIRRVGQGAGVGAGFGALTPVGDAQSLEDYWTQKASQVGGGALFGAALPAGIDLAKVPVKAVYHAIEPFLPGGMDRVLRRTLSEAAGPRRQQVMQELAKRHGIPLSQLQRMQTTGDATAAAGSAELAALQKIVEQLRPSEYKSLDQARNQARINALGRIARTPAEKALAINERTAKAAEQYGQAFENKLLGPGTDSQAETFLKKNWDKFGESRAIESGTTKKDIIAEGYDWDEWVDQYFSNYQKGDMVEWAKELGWKGGKANSIFRKTKSGELSVTDKDLGAILADPFVSRAMPTAEALMKSYGAKIQDKPVQYLHSVKLALDKELRRVGPDALDHAERAQVLKAKRALVDWLENRVPEYGAARKEFASRSVPINQMEVGQYLVNKLKPVMSDVGVDANQRAQAFIGALRDAPKTIKSSTGSEIYKDLSKILTPDQMRILDDVGADLGARAQFKDLARAGTPAARDITSSIRQEWRSPNPLHRGLMIFNQLLSRLQGRASKETLTELSKRFENPAQIEELLREMPPVVRRKLVEEALSAARELRPAVTVGTPVAGYAREF